MCHLARKLCMSSFSNYFWPSGKKESMCVISKPHKVKLNACMSVTSWLFRLVQRQNYVQKLHLFRARYRVKSGTCTVEVQWIKKPKRCWLCFTYLTLISLFELSACFFFLKKYNVHHTNTDSLAHQVVQEKAGTSLMPID